MQARSPRSQLLRSLQRLLNQTNQLKVALSRWSSKLLRCGLSTDHFQSCPSKLKMPADKCLISRLKTDTCSKRELKRRARKERCLAFTKIRDWITVLSIWECQQTRPFSDFNQEFARSTENSFYLRISLRFIHPSLLVDHQKVVPMCSNLTTSVDQLAWPRVPNSTNKWHFAVTLEEYSRLDQSSELNNRSQTDIFVSSQALT